MAADFTVLELILTTVTATSVVIIIGLNFKLQDVIAQSRTEIDNLNLLIDFVPQVLWRTDSENRVTYFNKRYEEVTGVDGQAAIRNQSWLQSFHPDDAPRFAAFRDRCTATGEGGRIETRHRQANGSYRWMMIDRAPVHSKVTGDLIGWVGGASDIEELFRVRQSVKSLTSELERKVEERSRELAQSQERFKALFYETNIAFAEEDISSVTALLKEIKDSGVEDIHEYINDNPALIDAFSQSIKLVRVSDTLLRIMEYENVDDLILDKPNYNKNDTRLLQIKLSAIFHKRNGISSFTTLISKSGRKIPMAMSINATPDWNIAFVTFIDATDQLQTQELLLAAQQELARANRIAAVGAFSASMAHELNQPIVAIGMDAQTSRQWLNQDPPNITQALRTLDRLTRNAERVVSITRSTREQITRGRNPHALIDIGALITDTVGLMERELEALQTQVLVECEKIFAIGDRVEVQQVINNLLTNAAEAMRSTEPDQRVVVVSASRAPTGRTQVSVLDNGPGIDEDRLEQMFEPFHTTKAEGIGLGLQICRTIVEAHGGTLVARNREPRGAKFEFDLPYTAQP